MDITTSSTSNPATIPHVGVMPKRWTREEYYRLAEDGFFKDQRVELIAGEILMMSPQSYPHFFSTDGVAELLRQAFGSKYWVRQQAPLALSDKMEPEPDVSVVAGTRFDFSDHPTSAVLVVEVAKTSLDYDTQTKPAIYAQAGIPEYWVLDLVNRQLIVHREPGAQAGNKPINLYQSVQKFDAADSVSPLDKPNELIEVAKMLPPA